MVVTRISTLDGWRAIAILMVLVTHYQEYVLNRTAHPDLGFHGVQIFFVLSGYLITSHLLKEERINLKAFYVRRVFRIMPAAVAFLLVVFLIRLTALDLRQDGDILGCLLLFRNYLPETTQNTYTIHFWSLSLEEQFYLFWPAALAFLGRVRAAVAAVVLVSAIAAFRLFAWNAYANSYRSLGTEVRADGLMIGCLLGLALAYEPARLWAERCSVWALGIAFPVLVLDMLKFHTLIPLHESIAIAVLIGATSLKPRIVLSQMLETTPIKTIGVWSYSIYLWQGLFMRSNFGHAWPIFLAGSVLVSYYIIEKPYRRKGRMIADSFQASPVTVSGASFAFSDRNLD